MTSTEDIIIDQLYFVTRFDDVLDGVELLPEALAAELWKLIEKGWVKCYLNPETEIQVSDSEFQDNFRNYHYLASKQGLLAHNRR